MPAVQWEPVYTIGNPDATPYAFPSPAGFLDDGGPTLIGATDVTLIPVAPAPVLGQVLIKPMHRRCKAAAVLFTLPFGMIAAATLPARTGIGPIEAEMSASGLLRPEVRPELHPPAGRWRGGFQVSLTQGTEQTVRRIRHRVAWLALARRSSSGNLVDENGDPVLGDCRLHRRLVPAARSPACSALQVDEDLQRRARPR